MNKKKQHYVWRYYLRPWTIDDMLFCLRDGKIFKSNPKGIAAQNYFYHTEELSQDDLDFIEKFVISTSPPGVQNSHRDWLKTHNFLFRKINQLKLKGGNAEKLAKVQSGVQTLVENNFYEELHCLVEGDAISYLDSLLNSNLMFYKEDEARVDFLCFLNIQYFRTNKVRTSVLDSAAKSMKTSLGINLEKIWHPLNHIFAMNVAWAMYTEGFKLFMFLNKSSVPFITGDQPVVNTYATNLSPGELVHEVEFYYPVSPQIAILVTKDVSRWGNEVIPVDLDTVNHYNDHIIRNSHDEVYASTREQLEQVIEK